MMNDQKWLEKHTDRVKGSDWEILYIFIMHHAWTELTLNLVFLFINLY